MNRRHRRDDSVVFDSQRPFSSVLEGIFGGISQPDIGLLLNKVAASTSYEQLGSLVQQAQGSAGLMRFPSPARGGRQAALNAGLGWTGRLHGK